MRHNTIDVYFFSLSTWVYACFIKHGELNQCIINRGAMAELANVSVYPRVPGSDLGTGRK